MNAWYLAEVWKRSKLLFAFILLFIFFQVLFSVKRVQNFPFFTYDMYSRPMDKPSEFTIYEIWSGNKRIDYTKLSNLQEMVVLNSIRSYESNLQSNGFAHRQVLEDRFKNNTQLYSVINDRLSNTQTSIENFPGWLDNYFLQGDDLLSVKRNTYRYPGNELVRSLPVLKEDGR